MELLTIFVLFAIFLIIISLYNFSEQKSLKKKRSGQDITTFIEYFSGETICKSICIEVYHSLQKHTWFRDFPVHPKDDIAKIYGICEEDFVDAIVELAEMCNRQLPSDEEIENGNVTTILLVEDLVRFLSSLDKIVEDR